MPVERGTVAGWNATGGGDGLTAGELEPSDTTAAAAVPSRHSAVSCSSPRDARQLVRGAAIASLMSVNRSRHHHMQRLQPHHRCFLCCRPSLDLYEISP